MKISINPKTDPNNRLLIISFVNSLKKNIPFLPIVNDYTKIDSFKTYIFSRYIEKLSSITANFVRIEFMMNCMEFGDLKEIISDDSEKLKEESLVELVSLILRPLTEIYLELKCIELCKEKFEMDIETSCNILYFDSIVEYYKLKLTISKEIYDCEPKYFKRWCETSEKGILQIKQELAEKNISLLQSTRRKYKSILENHGNLEKIALGFDYLAHYAILSKKMHFSYTNIPFSNMTANTYFMWCSLQMTLIYEMIMRMFEKEDEVKNIADSFLKSISKTMESQSFHNLAINDIAFLEFGAVRIIGISNLTFEVEYLVSNCFKTGEKDSIPRIFIVGKVNSGFFETIKKKYFDQPVDIYGGEKYDSFHLDMYNHSASKPLDVRASAKKQN